MAKPDVLIISSRPDIRAVFCEILTSSGFECLLAADALEGVEMFRGWRPQLVVTDYNLPVMSGVELLRRLREEDRDVAVIVVCGAAVKRGDDVVDWLDVDAARSECLRLGAYALVEKPVGVEELLRAAEGALERRQADRRQRQEPLERRWAEVRPMAQISELLAVFAGVCSRPRKA